MKLLKISVSREGFRKLGEQLDTRTINSIGLSLVEAEIFFDRHGNAKLMEKGILGTRMLSSASDVGYWKATDEEIDSLRRNGYTLPDWRTISVADIAKQYPDWAPEHQEETA